MDQGEKLAGAMRGADGRPDKRLNDTSKEAGCRDGKGGGQRGGCFRQMLVDDGKTQGRTAKTASDQKHQDTGSNEGNLCKH